MGLDGVVYASIAKLIAAGEGSFWFPPAYTMSGAPFHDHPPLGLWLQGQWFRLFGDAYWSEDSYITFLTLINAGLIVRLWRDLTDRSDAWWVLLILFLIPVTSFTIKYNALENLVSITALAAIVCAWHGRRWIWLNLAVSALCGVGFLIKGPVALFPLAAPLIFAVVVDRDWVRGVVTSLISIGGFLLVAVVTVSNTQAFESLSYYLDQQVWRSLTGERPVVNDRVFQLHQLSISLGICIVCCVIAWLTSRRCRIDRRFWAVLMIGCAASVPLLISPRHFKHYLLPSLPYFAMAAAMLVEIRMPIILRRVLVLTSAALLALLVLRYASNYGEPGKDRWELEETARIALRSQSATVAFCQSQPMLQAYLARHHNVKSVVANRTSGSAATPSAPCIDD
jgi:4-amino-4-deoxy-L-arabinose transferase-like glycosyltransferase